MCHEGRALLDLLDWSKNFDLGIRNQLFFLPRNRGQGSSSYTNLLSVFIVIDRFFYLKITS